MKQLNLIKESNFTKKEYTIHDYKVDATYKDMKIHSLSIAKITDQSFVLNIQFKENEILPTMKAVCCNKFRPDQIEELIQNYKDTIEIVNILSK